MSSINVSAIHAIYMYVQSVLTYMYIKLTGTYYHIAGNFRGAQFSRMLDLYYFAGLIFADSSTHVHYVLYTIELFFIGLIFTVRQSPTKIVKNGPLENFLLYGNSVTILLSTTSLHMM